MIRAPSNRSSAPRPGKPATCPRPTRWPCETLLCRQGANGFHGQFVPLGHFVAQLLDPFSFDLADALASQTIAPADFFKRPRRIIGEPETQVQNILLARVERRKLLLHQGGVTPVNQPLEGGLGTRIRHDL